MKNKIMYVASCILFLALGFFGSNIISDKKINYLKEQFGLSKIQNVSLLVANLSGIYELTKDHKYDFIICSLYSELDYFEKILLVSFVQNDASEKTVLLVEHEIKLIKQFLNEESKKGVSRDYCIDLTVRINKLGS